jgi:uncharacterized protein YlxP (DUF503 family)
VYVGLAKLRLAIAESHSLKEKRMVLRRIKDRVRERLHVAINEVGELDSWQRAELGCAVTSADRGKALALIDDVVRVVVAAGGAEVIALAKDAMTFDTALEERPAIADDWVPDEWREDLAEEER